MNNEKNLSSAQRRANRRKKQGKETGSFDFNCPSEVLSLEEYYDISLNQKKIASLLLEYDELNKQVYNDFLIKTQLDKNDLSFLLLAIALQCVRQYFLTPFEERVDHEHTKTEDKTKEKKLYEKTKDGENNRNKQGGYYYRTLEKIIFDGVPYDTMSGGKDFDLGLSGPNHRYKTLGHDPILGWVFGPMNIMTNTLSMHTIQSYHIRKCQVGNGYGPSIHSKAQNTKILEASVERLKSEPVACAAAVVKQAIHYNSDVNTKKSLPIPFIQTISPEFAKTVATYGLDMSNITTIGKQSGYSVLINSIIAMIHRMFYNPDLDGEEKLYKVRTQKILLYSNFIATYSNILYVAFTSDVKKLDIGGMIVTIYRIVTDETFIREVMYDFVDKQVTKKIDDELFKTKEEFEKLMKSYYEVSHYQYVNKV